MPQATRHFGIGPVPCFRPVLWRYTAMQRQRFNALCSCCAYSRAGGVDGSKGRRCVHLAGPFRSFARIGTRSLRIPLKRTEHDPMGRPPARTTFPASTTIASSMPTAGPWCFTGNTTNSSSRDRRRIATNARSPKPTRASSSSRPCRRPSGVPPPRRASYSKQRKPS